MRKGKERREREGEKRGGKEEEGRGGKKKEGGEKHQEAHTVFLAGSLPSISSFFLLGWRLLSSPLDNCFPFSLKA